MERKNGCGAEETPLESFAHGDGEQNLIEEIKCQCGWKRQIEKKQSSSTSINFTHETRCTPNFVPLAGVSNH
jgi:hypothetical protein